MSQNIAGSVAFVTGANRGIGRAIVDALVAAGAERVYATGRTLESLTPLTQQHGVTVVPLILDVRNDAQITAAVAAAGDVTLLVNNAGIALEGGKAFGDADASAGREQMDVNVFGTLAVTQAFTPVLARNGGGTVVNIVSIAALGSFPIFVSYSASKAALHSITQATRFGLKAQGTTVIGVYPGPVETEMTVGVPFDKVSPASVADQILAAIESGTEEVYPDPVGDHLGQTYTTEPKGVERAIAAMMAS